MKSALRTAAATAALLAASYGVIAPAQAAHTGATDDTTPRMVPVAEVGTQHATTPLPSSATDVVVDNVHRQVFVSTSGAHSVIVTDFDGQVTRTITGFAAPGEMTLSDDSSVLYVAERGREQGQIGAIDTQTYAVSHVSTPGGVCPESLTFTAGKVWYWWEPCASYDPGGVGVVDSGVASNVFPVTRPQGVVRALPNRPDRMVLVSRDGFLSVYDVSGTTPALVVEGTSAGSRETCVDAALISGGDQVVTACEPLLEHEVFDTSDLSSAPSITSSAQPAAVAVTPDGRYVAAAVRGTHWPDIFVSDIQGGVPGTLIHQYDFTTELSGTQTGSVAFSDDGRLFAVERSSSAGDAVLHVLTDATVPTKVTLNTPRAVPYRGSVTGTGTVIGASEGDMVSLTRRDRTGEYPLDPLPVAANGTFSFTDEPAVTGPVTYVVGYPDDHSFTGVKSTTTVRPLPYDVDADGHAETVVGAYAEDIGTVKDAGMFHLMYGGAAGVETSGSLGIDQGTAGVPGTVEAGDMFGYSNTSGDFNGDGYADVAVSAGAENVGTATDGGAVWIFHGSPSGLRTDNVATLDIADTVWTGTDYAYLGDALTAGDFDGDGRDDLAIGAAGVDEVIVANGTPDGLATTGLTYFSESTAGVPGTRHEDERFGHSVVAGDINADGRDELAVGAAYDYDDRGWSTGSVTVLYGGADGLTGTGAQRFSKDTTGVPGGGGSFDEASGDASDGFGHQIALADFNGDGGADLAVGAPGSPVTVDGVRKRDAGTLTVLYSSGTAITTTGAVQVDQQTTGMPGSAGQEDQLGTTLAAGDTDGDGSAELAAYSVGDTYVTVIPGASAGAGFGSAKGWTQNSTGIPGSSETGDYWGNSLRFADVKGTGYAALIVGADGENDGAGACTVIYGTSSGLTATGSVYLSQNTTGVAGTPENGDGFGTFF